MSETVKELHFLSSHSGHNCLAQAVKILASRFQCFFTQEIGLGPTSTTEILTLYNWFLKSEIVKLLEPLSTLHGNNHG